VHHSPAARAHEARNSAQRPGRFGLVHQERPGEGKVERAVQRRHVKHVNVTGEELYVLQSKRRNHRPCALNGRLAEVNADHPPSWSHHLRALSRIPALLGAELRPGHLWPA
jgi:hypothetical protein